MMVCFHHGSASASASTRCSSTRCSPWLNASSTPTPLPPSSPSSPNPDPATASPQRLDSATTIDAVTTTDQVQQLDPTTAQTPDQWLVPNGLGAERCAYDPCVYGRVINDAGDRVVTNVYVDDVRMYWDTSDAACVAAAEDQKKIYDRHQIKWGAVDPPEDYFLGANRSASEKRDVVRVCATSYIDAMVDRYLENDISPCRERPASWGYVPADESLVRAYEAATTHRAAAPPKLFQAYNSLVGSLRHAVKYRPEISAAMDLLAA